MNGRDLALGLVGALALAGAVRRRGSASLEAWPNADALARTFADTMANATAQQMGRWAKKNGLAYIGSGQSRAVFAEPDGTRVLKLVFSSYGRESNRDEQRAPQGRAARRPARSRSLRPARRAPRPRRAAPGFVEGVPAPSSASSAGPASFMRRTSQVARQPTS